MTVLFLLLGNWLSSAPVIYTLDLLPIIATTINAARWCSRILVPHSFGFNVSLAALERLVLICPQTPSDFSYE